MYGSLLDFAAIVRLLCWQAALARNCAVDRRRTASTTSKQVYHSMLRLRRKLFLFFLQFIFGEPQRLYFAVKRRPFHADARGCPGAVSCKSLDLRFQIGRASCRERVCTYEQIAVVDVASKKKK